MTSGSLRDLVEAYASSRDPQYFAPAATVQQMPLGRVVRGRAAISAMFRSFYLDMLSDPVERIVGVAVDEARGIGVVESTFRGRHAREALGLSLGGARVEIPLVGVYEVEGGLIARGRLYFDVATLLGRFAVGGEQGTQMKEKKP